MTKIVRGPCYGCGKLIAHLDYPKTVFCTWCRMERDLLGPLPPPTTEYRKTAAAPQRFRVLMLVVAFCAGVIAALFARGGL